MRLHKHVKREEDFCSSWTMQPQKNGLKPHNPVEPCRARIVPTSDSQVVPTNNEEDLGQTAGASDGAKPEARAPSMRVGVTRAFTTLSPASAEFYRLC